MPHKPQLLISAPISISHPSISDLLQSIYPAVHAAIVHAPDAEQVVTAFATFTSHDKQLCALQPLFGSEVLTHCSLPKAKQAFSPLGHCPFSSVDKSLVTPHALAINEAAKPMATKEAKPATEDVG